MSATCVQRNWRGWARPCRRPQRAGTERPEALALVRLLLLTGARLGEIQALRWEWIDWRGRRMRLPDSKTGAKTIYLSAAALAVLA